MPTLHMTERTGKDGILHVSVPLGQPDADFDVVMTVQPKNRPDSSAASEWPPGYFDLAGSITDDTFARPPQGELPPPLDVE